MREIVLDTETTGLKPEDGHRIIEIGALEMINHIPTDKTFHVYINPERDIEAAAIAVHGLTRERLASEPVFSEIVDDFLNFVGEASLVIHNAPFDMGFINAELIRCGRSPLAEDRVIDTLVMARRKFPGSQASLDALCRKFGIDNSHRDLHGAMIDTDLLAEVYIELLGGKQPDLSLTVADKASKPLSDSVVDTSVQPSKTSRPLRHFTVSEDEEKAHQDFLDGLKDPLWNRSEH